MQLLFTLVLYTLSCHMFNRSIDRLHTLNMCGTTNSCDCGLTVIVFFLNRICIFTNVLSYIVVCMYVTSHLTIHADSCRITKDWQGNGNLWSSLYVIHQTTSTNQACRSLSTNYVIYVIAVIHARTLDFLTRCNQSRNYTVKSIL